MIRCASTSVEQVCRCRLISFLLFVSCLTNCVDGVGVLLAAPRAALHDPAAGDVDPSERERELLESSTLEKPPDKDPGEPQPPWAKGAIKLRGVNKHVFI